MRLTQTAAIVASLAFVALPAALAGAQTPPPEQSINDLRQEAERLRQEQAQKDADLAAALKRIKELEAQLAAAKAAAAPGGQTGTSGGNTSPAAPVPAPVPADPTLGPGGLLSSLQADYLAAFPTLPDLKDQQALNLHLRALENWCAKANRDGTKQYSWTGQVDPTSLSTNGKTASFVIVFTNGKREYRTPVTVDQSVVSARVRTRDGIVPGDLVFNGIVRPRLSVNGRRPQPSAFENPPMLAPYLEYFYEFEVKSMTPVAPAAPAK